MNYEGYGLGGIAVFVEASSNNGTRTVGNVRSYFNKCKGSLGVSGSLEFIFERKARFYIPAEGVDEDDLTLNLIDAGAEEVEKADDVYEVFGPVDSFGTIQEKLQEINVTPDEAALIRVPVSYKDSDDEEVLKQFDKLIGLLEEDEDVVTVYHNFESRE